MHGSIVALITPFLNNKVNYTKLEEILDYHLFCKTNGILLLGTTAETSSLSANECHEIVKYCYNYLNNRITIIVGVCCNNTNKVIKQIQYYKNIGITNFLVIAPYYNKTNEYGLYNHFKTIANCTKANIIIYNIPSRTNINISFDNIKKLSTINNIIGIKEANENIKDSIKLFELQNENFNIYCGNDELILPFMSLGAKGFINVCGNIIAKEYVEIYNLIKKNDFNGALDIFNLYRNLIINIFNETNPIGIKEAMNILSMNNKEIRLPLYQMSDINHELIKKEILKIGKHFNN